MAYTYLIKKKKFTFAMHSHKVSTPTGTPVPDEKVKELSSIDTDLVRRRIERPLVVLSESLEAFLDVVSDLCQAGVRLGHMALLPPAGVQWLYL